MVTMDQVLGFGLVALVLIAIPGPSVVFTVGRALTYGRAVALTTVLGNSLGLLAALILVSLGLGDLVATSDTAFEVLKLGGAASLVWLGVQALRHREPLEVWTTTLLHRDNKGVPVPGTFDNSPFSIARGFDIIVPRSTMEIVYSTNHGTPQGNENITGEELLAEIQAVAAGL